MPTPISGRRPLCPASPSRLNLQPNVSLQFIDNLNLNFPSKVQCSIVILDDIGVDGNIGALRAGTVGKLAFRTIYYSSDGSYLCRVLQDRPAVTLSSIILGESKVAEVALDVLNERVVAVSAVCVQPRRPMPTSASS